MGKEPDEITKLRAEVDRLQKAMVKIIKLDDEWEPEHHEDYTNGWLTIAADIARAALEEK